MPKRTSAFSKALQEAQQGATDQTTSTPVQNQASVEAQKQMSALPVERLTSIPVSELTTSKEVYQTAGKEVQRDNATEVQRDSSTPGEKQASKPLIKASYYISPDDDWKLEQIRIQRRRRGIKVDKSALIREAIALLQE